MHKQFPVRLDHVNTMGAFFRFRSDLLYDEDFRSSGTTASRPGRNASGA
jgi:hypothetical protein